MSATGDVSYDQKYLRAWEALTLLGMLFVSVAFIAVSQVLHRSQAWSEGLKAVGESVLASLIVYVLVAVFLSPRQQKAQTRQVTTHAIEEANRQFQSIFAVSLPNAVHESSPFLKASFRTAFESILKSSTRYDYKGDSAKFTTFRLAMGTRWPAIGGLDQVRLCILNPLSEDPMRACAERQLRERGAAIGRSSVEAEATQTQRDIYVSLITLFDIRDSLMTTVYFHQDLPLYRCEVFDKGMFLTYYLGSASYPESLEFALSTRPYQAYRAGIELTRRFSARMVQFGEIGSSSDLFNTEQKMVDLLRELGCEYTLAQLRTMRDERFAIYKARLKDAGFDSREIF